MKKYTIFVVINSLLTDIVFELICGPTQSNNDGSTCRMCIDDVEMVRGYPSRLVILQFAIKDGHFLEKLISDLLYV